MSAILIAAGFVFVGFVGGLVGRRLLSNPSAVTPEPFEFRYGQVEPVGLKEKLLQDRDPGEQ